MAIRDPLFDSNRRHATTAAAKEDATRSPISGQPMTPLMCRNIPVMVDLPNRVVVPVFDDASMM